MNGTVKRGRNTRVFSPRDGSHERRASQRAPKRAPRVKTRGSGATVDAGAGPGEGASVGMGASSGLSLARRILQSRAAHKLWQCTLRAAAGFIAAQGAFGGTRAPFGAAFAAAGAALPSAGAAGVLGALGAAAGSIMRFRMSDSLRYMAAALLSAVAVYAAQDTRLASKVWFRPLCAVASLAAVGLVTLTGGGQGGAVMLICELILSCGAAFAYQHLLAGQTGAEPLRHPRIPPGVAEVGAAATLMFGLAGFTLPGGVAPVRIAALALALFCGYSGGAGAGAASGLAFGAASGGSAGFCVMAAFGGLGAGIVRGSGRTWSCMVFLMSAVAAALIDMPDATSLYETTLAGALFMLIPERRLPVLAMFSPPSRGGAERRALAACERQQTALGRALGELGKYIAGAPPVEERELGQVFDRAASRACSRCALRTLCWERDRLNTCAAMNSLETALVERGRVVAADLPASFASRCLRPDLFLAAVNEEMRVWQLGRISARRLEYMRRAAGSECEAIAGLLGVAPERTRPAPAAELKLRRALKTAGIEAECEAWRTAEGRLCAEISGRELSPFASDGGAALSNAVGVRFAPPELRRLPDGDLLLVRQREPRSATVGVACRRRNGSPRSGDSGIWFRTASGELVVIVSDGMGSGGEAAGDSQATVRLVEQLVRAGCDPQRALAAVSGAMALRNEERAGFASADLCILDLFGGNGKLLKCGAAPTYLRYAGRTGRVSGGNLPGGLSPRSQVREVKLRLGDCDCVVMVTDGVCDGSDDGWLRELIRTGGDDPRALAARIADAAWERTGGADDLTAVCISLSPR